MAPSSANLRSAWAFARRTVTADRYGRTLGLVCGIIAAAGTYINDGAEAAMVLVVTIFGLLAQFRMFLAAWRVIESIIRGSLDRRELTLCLSLGAAAFLMQVITRVPITVTTAFAAVGATALYGVIHVIRRRR